jgi:hypothetical protein
MIEQIKKIVEGLNIAEKERLKADGYTNQCFFNEDGSLTDCYKWTLKEKKKYFYFDCGTSGAFMVDKGTGLVFGIKGYGVAHKNKVYGNVKNFDGDFVAFGKMLHNKRF